MIMIQQQSNGHLNTNTPNTFLLEVIRPCTPVNDFLQCFAIERYFKTCLFGLGFRKNGMFDVSNVSSDFTGNEVIIKHVLKHLMKIKYMEKKTVIIGR